MPRTCDHDGGPYVESCAVCRLYRDDPRYRAAFDGVAVPPQPERSLPCLFLGDVISQMGCNCPGMWLRKCAIHQTCTITTCKTCPDYTEGGS